MQYQEVRRLVLGARARLTYTTINSFLFNNSISNNLFMDGLLWNLITLYDTGWCCMLMFGGLLFISMVFELLIYVC